MTGYGVSSIEQERKKSQKPLLKNIETKITSSEKNILGGEMSIEPINPNLFIPRAYSEIKRLVDNYIRK